MSIQRNKIRILPLTILVAFSIITLSYFDLHISNSNEIYASAQQTPSSPPAGLLSLHNMTGAPLLLNATDPLSLTPEEEYTGPPREVTEPGVPNATLLRTDKL